MRRTLGAGIVLAFLLAGQAALAQTKTHTESTTKRTGPGPDTKKKSESVTGTVKEYEAGKKIKITGPKNKDYSWDLDENAKVEGNITVGQTAKVKFTKDQDGKKHVTVLSEAKAGAMSHKHGKMGSSSSSSVPAGGAMHAESTTKRTGAGPNTKVKTEVVVGKVKEYEAGKKIVVTGPKNKDYSFDLDENVAMKRTVNAGDRVKVTYTKGDKGDKATTIAPYTGKKSTKKVA